VSHNLDARRVLVVDDDRSIVELVCTRLTLAGYNAFAARDGHEAITHLTGLRPAAMVLDLNMPSLDGFGVLAQMGKEGTDRTPTLVLTARHATTDVQRAISLGARDYLSKPFNDNQLLMRVARLMRKRPNTSTLEETIANIDRLMS
jgi:DNA-binding response OmpR family regulator